MIQTLAPQKNSRDVLELPAERPFVLEFFLVESSGFRGMAYRDQDSHWYKALTKEQLNGEVVILE